MVKLIACMHAGPVLEYRSSCHAPDPTLVCLLCQAFQRQLQGSTDEATCYVPDVVRRVSESMASTLDNVGVRLIIDPVVAAFEGHVMSSNSADRNSFSSSSSQGSRQGPQSHSESRDSMGGGQPAHHMSGAKSAGALKEQPDRQKKKSAGSVRSGGANHRSERKEEGPVLLPPPRLSRLLKNPVLADSDRLIAHAPAEVCLVNISPPW